MHQYHHHHRQQQQQQQQHAIVPYDPNGATREVLAIMKAVVSKKSEKNTGMKILRFCFGCMIAI